MHMIKGTSLMLPRQLVLLFPNFLLDSVALLFTVVNLYVIINRFVSLQYTQPSVPNCGK